MMSNLFNKMMYLALCAAALVFSLSAHAISLEEAKSQGLVGETYTGYLAVVKAKPELNALVSEINAKRKQVYQKMANDNGLTLDVVEKMAGKKAIEKTEAGHYIDLGQGWQQK